jgi:hypothetical protein
VTSITPHASPWSNPKEYYRQDENSETLRSFRVAKNTYVGIDANRITTSIAMKTVAIVIGRYATDETAASGIRV